MFPECREIFYLPLRRQPLAKQNPTTDSVYPGWSYDDGGLGASARTDYAANDQIFKTTYGAEKAKPASVTSKVTQKGKPITGGSVWLHPASGNTYAGEKPSGRLQLDGSFTARTFPHGD